MPLPPFTVVLARVAKTFLLPLILAEGVFYLFARGENHLLSAWEVASLVHLLLGSWAISTVDVPFVRERTVQRMKYFVTFASGAVALIKFVGVLIALVTDTPTTTVGTEAGWLSAYHLVEPHLLMLPLVLFFVTNFMLDSLIRKNRDSVADFTKEERALRGMIAQVDLPIVASYGLFLLYIWTIPETVDADLYFRGVACALLTVSNFATTAFDVFILDTGNE